MGQGTTEQDAEVIGHPGKMDAELKAKWIAALRSGEYKQVRGMLKSARNTFCCLGVLADVQDLKWEVGCPFLGGKNVALAGHLAPEAAGGLLYGEQVTLAKMNDEGSSFSKIADYIEANL